MGRFNNLLFGGNVVTRESDLSKDDLIKKLSDCVVDMEDEAIVEVAETYIQKKYPARWYYGRISRRYEQSRCTLRSAGVFYSRAIMLFGCDV